MIRVAIALLSLGLIAVAGLGAFFLLPACGLRVPFTDRVLSICEAPELRELRNEALDIAFENDGLTAQISALERQLAGHECVAEKPPPPPPPPKVDKTPSGLDPDAFKDGDISVMRGCWQLITVYKTSDIRTGKVTTYKDWRVCFDDNGNGNQTMRSTDGAVCSSSIKGQIDSGKLVMREPANLQCSNGYYIYRRDVTCTLDETGRAHCVSFQPQVGGRGNAVLRRSR